MSDNTKGIDQIPVKIDSLIFAFEMAGIGIWDLTLGPDPTVFWDERCRALFGVTTTHTLRYEETLELIHENDRKMLDDAVNAALQPQSEGRFDVRCRIVRLLDHEIIRLVRFTGKVIFDADGKAERFSGIAMDVSSEMVAREEQQKLKYLVDNSPDFMGISNHEGKVEFLNPSAYQLLGIDTDTDLATLHSADFYYPEEFARVQSVYKTVRENGSWAGNVVIRHFKTGEEIPCKGAYETILDNETGLPIGRSATLRDLRPELRSQKALLDSEAMFRNVTQNAPTGLWMSDVDGKLTYLNKTLVDWTGMSYEDLLGHGWANAVIEEGRQKSGEIFMNAVKSRAHYDVEFRLNKSDGSVCWCRAAGDPYYEEDGTYAGYAGFCMDIHQSVDMADKILESEQRIRSIVDQAPVAIGVLRGENLVVESGNETILKVWGKDQSIMGKPIVEALPEIDGQGFVELLEDVYRTGTPYHGNSMKAELEYDGEQREVYFDFVYSPIRDSKNKINGILIVASDVTRQVLAKTAIAESEAKFRNLIEEAPVATAVMVGRDLIIDVANEPMLAFWGKGDSIFGMPLAKAVPELEGQDFLEILDDVYMTGNTYESEEAKAELIVNGEPRTFYFNFCYKPLFDSEGKVYAIIDMAIDVTEQVLNKQKLIEAEAQARSAIENARLGTWEVDLKTGEYRASDRLKDWFGFNPDEKMEFQDILDGIADSETLATGVHRAMHGENEGKIDVEYTIVNKITGRNYMMESQGQTFFDEEGVATLIIGTTRDITLQRTNENELERMVQERTEELQATNEEIAATNEELADANENLFRSNEELAQYAYVASHDLQEPLRKIRIFADMLDKQQSLTDENRRMVEKINKSSERMTLLIKDLLEFSSLSRSENTMKQVDLNQVIKDITTDFELVISEKNALIHLAELPVIDAVALQMNQLFYNLLSNALKFTGEHRRSEITISSRIMEPEEVKAYIPKSENNTYHELVFQDNGIGFDAEYAEQIFEVFKRLHGKDVYPGSGIGLALCRRIAMNHGGHLYAKSVEGEGTAFHLILPASSN